MRSYLVWQLELFEHTGRAFNLWY